MRDSVYIVIKVLLKTKYISFWHAHYTRTLEKISLLISTNIIIYTNYLNDSAMLSLIMVKPPLYLVCVIISVIVLNCEDYLK